MNMKENFYSITKTGFLIFITMFIAIIGLPCLFLPRRYTAMLIHNWSKIMLFLFRKLDNLDNHFLSLIKKRTLLVNQVLLTKKFKNQIIDKKRIKKILANIKSKSIKKNIDVKITNEIWKSMIRAYIKYEFRKFKK